MIEPLFPRAFGRSDGGGIMSRNVLKRRVAAGANHTLPAMVAIPERPGAFNALLSEFLSE